ncbi:LolA family protein [Salisaeta longa]|uniref:LolA family protein n=1 Tax=Salisaeta longa TaxID=503170 RepID=UPI0003F96551|nr:outer membrane lipoprotein carrier protein LolA [Salisaeta longa]
MRSLLVCVLWLVLAAGGLVAQPAPATVTLQAVQARYNALDGLRAQFTQRTTSTFGDGSQTTDGIIWLQRNRYRIETGTETIVSNGTTLWIYDRVQEQVIIDRVDDRAQGLTPTAFFSDFAARFAVTERRSGTRLGAPHAVLTLAAQSDTTRFEALTLWVRTTDRLITQLVARDRNGTSFEIALRTLVPNPSLPANTFRFTPPDTADVVDLRSS